MGNWDPAGILGRPIENSKTYRFVDWIPEQIRSFVSARAPARSPRRAEANRVFVLILTTKRYVLKLVASLRKFLDSLLDLSRILRVDRESPYQLG